MVRRLGVILAAAIMVAGCRGSATPAGNSVLDPGLLRVQDRAEILPATAEIELARKSEALEGATSDQLVVVTVPTLGGKDIARFSIDLGNRMRVGQADRDNGVLLVVAPNERKVRIAVGYGLEGLLTDARAAGIVQHMLPYLRADDRARAIRIGVDEIDIVLRSDKRRPQYLTKKAA